MSVDINISIKKYTQDLSSCTYDGTEIQLGYEFIQAQKILSDKDFNLFLSDTITHEFLHAIIMREFDSTTSKLFDTVEHLLNNHKLKEKVFKSIRSCNIELSPITWNTSIIKYGFKDFLNDYHISTNDIIQAYLICNGV